MREYIKDPAAVLPYTINWATADTELNDGSDSDTGWLQGDTIATSSWAVVGPDSVLEIDSNAKTTTSAQVTLSGGSLGETYTVTNHIITTAGLEDDRSLKITITQK